MRLISAFLVSLAAVALAAGDASAQSSYRVVVYPYAPAYAPSYQDYADAPPTYYSAPTYDSSYQSYSYVPDTDAAPTYSPTYQGYYYAVPPAPVYSTYSYGGSSEEHPRTRWAGRPHAQDYDAWGRPVNGYETWGGQTGG
jgi:hypothetical protein